MDVRERRAKNGDRLLTGRGGIMERKSRLIFRRKGGKSEIKFPRIFLPFEREINANGSHPFFSRNGGGGKLTEESHSSKGGPSSIPRRGGEGV